MVRISIGRHKLGLVDDPVNQLPLGHEPQIGFQRDTLGRQRIGCGKNLNTGAEHYNKDVLAGRLSAEFDNGDVFIRLAGDRTEDNSNPRHGARLVGNLGLPNFVPTENLQVSAMFGYTNADYKEFLTFIAGGTTPVDVSDQRVFQNTPKFVANVAATWSTDLAGGRLSITPAVALRSEQTMFEIPVPLLDQPATVLVDASANWVSADDRFTLGIHGRNLTDEQYRVGGYNFPGALLGNSVIGFYGPPRTVAVTAGIRF